MHIVYSTTFTLKQGPHTDCFSCVTIKQREKMVFRVLTPPENGAGEKNVNISRKNWVPEWCKLKKFMYIYSVQPPIKKIQNHREPPYKLCLEKACLLCPPPSSALVMGSFSHGSRLWTFTWSKPASGPEFPAPLNSSTHSLCSPSFPSQPTCSGYLQWAVHVLPLSL